MLTLQLSIMDSTKELPPSKQTAKPGIELNENTKNNKRNSSTHKER
jgi:hypothetical protein